MLMITPYSVQRTRLLGVALSGLLLAGLTACSKPNKDVEFSPEKGEERRYQVASTAEMSVETGRRTERFTTRSQQLLRYKVTDIGKETRIEIHMDYLQLRDGRGGGVRSSRSAASDPELHALLAEGFAITTDLQTGEVKTFAALNDEMWQALLTRRGDEVQQELENLFASSAFISRVPAKEGATVTLPTYHGQSDATLTVLSVTDTHVLAQVAASPEGGQLYGQLLLSRERGWLEKLVLVLEVPFEQYGYQGKVRHQLLMTPYSPTRASLFQQLNYDLQRPGFEYQAQPDFTVSAANQPPTKQQVFPWDIGYFSQDDDQVNLSYQHDFSGIKSQSDLQFGPVIAINAQGEEIPLQLAAQGHYTYAGNDGFYKSGQQNLMAGWNAPDQLLEEVAELRSNAAFFPAEVAAFTLTPNSDKPVTVHQGPFTVTLAPVAGEPLRFALTTQGPERYSLLHRYDGAEGAAISFPVAEFSGPAWLNEQEQSLLDMIMAPYYQHGQSTMFFQFETLPAQLTLYTNIVAEQPLYQQEVRFVPIAQYAQAETFPPSSEYLLFDEERYSAFKPDDEPASTAHNNLAQLEPERVNHSGIALTLSAELAQVCSLAVTAAPQVSAQPLVWTELNKNNTRTLPRQVRYQLTTEDGIRRHFHDISVNTKLVCQGMPQWQPLDYQPETAWLIDVTQLPEWDENWSMQTFLQRYRFLNQQGQALSPVVADWSVNLLSQTLAEQLKDQRWLSIQGRVAQIQQLTVSGEPQQRDWQIDFPALP